MKHLKRLLALMLAVLMLIGVAACGETSSSADKSSSSGQEASSSSDNSSEVDDNAPVKGGTLVYGHRVGVTSIDTTQLSNAWSQLGPCVERLGRIQTNSDYEPWLVEEYVRDNDAMTVTMKPKSGIKFHDGSDFTAEVLAWNINRYINSGQNSVIGNPSKCEVNGDEVVVYFDTYSLDWEYFLSFAYMYSKDYMDEHGEDCYNMFAVGTGPYKMVSYETNDKTVFEKFDGYWGEEPYLDRIIYIYFADELGMVTAFLNKEIGWISSSADNYQKMIEEAGYESIELPVAMTGNCILFFNDLIDKDSKYPNQWKDVNVRKAVALYGIDYDNAVYAIKGDNGYHYYQWAVPGGLAFDESLEKLAGYDKDKALQMLSDAGYPDGFDTWITTHTGNSIEGTVVQSALKELGINAEVNLVASTNNVRDEGKTGGLFIASYGVQVNQTQNFTSHWAPGGNMKNMWNFTDEAYEIVDRIKTAQTQEDKIAAMKDYVKWMCFDECLAVSLHFSDNKNYVQDFVFGLAEASEYNFVDMASMWITDEFRNI